MGGRKRGALTVGTSGYQYDHWRGRFYPEELPKRQWFQHYAEHFTTVELNRTFYSLPDERVFDAWRKAAPPGFVYAVKFSRYGSHIKKLKDPEESIDYFLARTDRLGPHLGPILVQLPPRFRVNLERLAEFLEAAPWGYRWVLEVRDESWLDDRVYDLLQAHRVALCVHDLLEDHPRVTTTDFTYRRFHGPGPGYGGSYARDVLRAEADWIRRERRAGRDVYAYFNNDFRAYAVRNARSLIELCRAR